MGISVWSILVVILMLGVIVTVHELGHFWVARLLKIRAFEVAIFVGPKLFSWNRKGVDYSIRALPFGAYVRFTDIDENGDPVESDDPDLLINQKRWKRLLVALAGPFMNALLGIIIFTAMYCIFGFTSVNLNRTYSDTQLYAAFDGHVAEHIGDQITHINGHRIFTYLDLYYEVNNGTPQGSEMTVTLKSNKTGESYDVQLVPVFTTRPMLGIAHVDGTDNPYNGWEIIEVMEGHNNGEPLLKPEDYLVSVNGKPVADEDFLDYFDTLTTDDPMHLVYYRNGVLMEGDCAKNLITYPNDRGISIIYYRVDSVKDFFEAVKTAALMPVTIINVSVRAVGDVFEGEEEVYNMVSGPVGVTTVVSDVVDDVTYTFADKALNVIRLAAIVSMSLVFTNMLPIPGLDGVQVLFILVEMIIGRTLSKKTETVINAIGFVFLIGLVIFACTSDIIRIIVGGI